MALWSVIQGLIPYVGEVVGREQCAVPVCSHNRRCMCGLHAEFWYRFTKIHILLYSIYRSIRKVGMKADNTKQSVVITIIVQ